jgi:hypothetical protein
MGGTANRGRGEVWIVKIGNTQGRVTSMGLVKGS